MAREAPRDLVAVATHVLDLRSEFEAQLRAIARIEAQLAKDSSRRGIADHELSDVLRRELVRDAQEQPEYPRRAL